jgi:hypothetical protein
MFAKELSVSGNSASFLATIEACIEILNYFGFDRRSVQAAFH